MKKLLLPIIIILTICSCSVFHKKEKYGCPANGRSVGAEKLATGDPKALKLSKSAKYRGGNKFKGMN